jgi:H+/Cl- antiporter ClcA
MRLSERIYSFVRENPVYLPLLIIAMALIGLCAALLLKYAKECRGGGIPSAVAGIRGLIPMKWVQGLLGIFASSLLTFIAGVPLGNEGLSVQMGSAVGKGNSDVFNKKKKALERYLMAGSACSLLFAKLYQIAQDVNNVTGEMDPQEIIDKINDLFS